MPLFFFLEKDNRSTYENINTTTRGGVVGTTHLIYKNIRGAARGCGDVSSPLSDYFYLFCDFDDEIIIETVD